jgi:hypothetical protein
MIVRRDGPSVRLYSRNAYDWTARLAAIAAAVERITAKSFTIDGEAVVSVFNLRIPRGRLWISPEALRAPVAAAAFPFLRDGLDEGQRKTGVSRSGCGPTVSHLSTKGISTKGIARSPQRVAFGIG